MGFEFENEEQHWLFDRVVESEDFSLGVFSSQEQTRFHQDLQKLVEMGLLERRGWHYFPTEQGLWVAKGHVHKQKQTAG